MIHTNGPSYFRYNTGSLPVSARVQEGERRVELSKMLSLQTHSIFKAKQFIFFSKTNLFLDSYRSLLNKRKYHFSSCYGLMHIHITWSICFQNIQLKILTKQGQPPLNQGDSGPLSVRYELHMVCAGSWVWTFTILFCLSTLHTFNFRQAIILENSETRCLV